MIDGAIGGLLYTFEQGSSSALSAAKEPAAEEAEPEELEEPEPTPEAEPEEPEAAAPAAAGDFEPVEGTVNGYPVAILGAEAVTDTDDEPAIRVYYSFTNNSDELASASWALYNDAYERGYELDTTYVWSEDNVEEYGNYGRDIYPGVTILCERIYSCNPDDDIITFSLHNYDESDVVSYDFSYSDLPGRPEPIELTDVEEPVVTVGLDSEGSLDDDQFYVAITGYELTEDYYSNPAIRVFYDFTNNSNEATSFWLESYWYTYQDGGELDTTWAYDETETDENADIDIEPGESISCSKLFALYNETDMVETTLYIDYGEYIGAVFYLD